MTATSLFIYRALVVFLGLLVLSFWARGLLGRSKCPHCGKEI